MAVEKKSSDLIHNYLNDASVAADPVAARGRAIYATGAVENAAADSNLSTYHLLDLPSDCILHPDSFFKVDIWGFAQVMIGTEADPAALVNQAKLVEAMVTPLDAGDVSHGKRLWQTLGFAADPGGNIGIYAHAVANATVGGSIKFQIKYLYH